MCLLHAKRLTALYWRKIDRPKLGHWLRDMSSSLAIEKITYILKGKKELFEIVWTPFILYPEGADLSQVLVESGEPGVTSFGET